MMWLVSNGIKSMYVNSLDCVKVKRGENECFRISSCVRHGCIMSPWHFNVYMDTVMKKLKMGMGRRGERVQEEEREWRLPGLLYVDDLALCGESESQCR